VEAVSKPVRHASATTACFIDARNLRFRPGRFKAIAKGRADPHDSGAGPIQESVAADVRRFCSIGFLQSEPPYVGCYNSAFS